MDCIFGGTGDVVGELDVDLATSFEVRGNRADGDRIGVDRTVVTIERPSLGAVGRETEVV